MDFSGAPVSRLLFVALAATNLFYLGTYVGSSSLTFSSLTSSPFPAMICYHFAFPDRGTALWSSVLLYQQGRMMEKIMGSRKFLSFVLLSGFASALWSLLLLSFLPSLAFSSGPFLLLFAVLALYTKHVPTCEPNLASALSISITDKTFSYIMALQVALSNGLSSALPSLLGYVAGLAYCSAPFAPFRDDLLLGPWVSGLLSSLDAALSGSPPGDHHGLASLSPDYASAPPSRSPAGAAAGGTQGRMFGGGPAAHRARGGGGGEGVVDFNRPLIDPAAFGGLGAGGFEAGAARAAGRAGAGAGARGAAAPREDFEQLQVAPPTEDSIKYLMDMGFAREASAEALRRTDNNVEYALNRLLDS